MIEDQQLMEKIREIYGLTGKLAHEVRLKSSEWPPGIFGGMEFAGLIGAFMASLKKHYGLSAESESMAGQMLGVMGSQDMETLASITDKTVNTIRQLSDDDATGFMFHFFWPHLYSELAKPNS